VRQALDAAAPGLADARIELAPDTNTSNPKWASSTAIVGGSFVLKFAWSQEAAARVLRESHALATLARFSDLPVPQLVGASAEPVAFLTRLVGGTPLSFDDVRSAGQVDRDALAEELASFLARLHEPVVLEAVQEATPLVAPEPQGTTAGIRARLPRFLDRRRAQLVSRWCEWVDDVLHRPEPRPVLAHGDLHGYNQVWSRDPWKLQLVADFEVAGPTDPEYDFRYFPSQDRSGDFVTAVRARYTALTNRAADMDRVMAWHVRTALGDALWRSEAGVALPGGGTPSTYVDDLELKLGTLVAL
jgi:aminoglycoside phosphotransferase (APT) family kinase protein